MTDDISLGELSRRLAETFARIEGQAARLESGLFVRTDLFVTYKELVDRTLKTLENQLAALEKDKAERDALLPIEARVNQLEDDRKWLVRLVLGFIVLGVLGAIYVASGGSLK